MKRFATTLLASSALGALAVSGVGSAQAPGSRPAPPPKSAAIPRPTLEAAQKALNAAITSARTQGVALSCAVVDVRGDLVALIRMDDAAFQTASIAEGKAMSSALFDRPSADLARMGGSPFFASLNASMGNRMIPAQGAVPILRNDRVIGAIGCSGGAPQQDETAAKAGEATF
ncbi:MAG TPA: heme-binding protein [Steroidobacteraceae bacterium]|nr:heme-binding protein [Steroidobacteraceae bacterium]